MAKNKKILILGTIVEFAKTTRVTFFGKITRRFRINEELKDGTIRTVSKYDDYGAGASVDENERSVILPKIVNGSVNYFIETEDNLIFEIEEYGVSGGGGSSGASSPSISKVVYNYEGNTIIKTITTDSNGVETSKYNNAKGDEVIITDPDKLKIGETCEKCKQDFYYCEVKFDKDETYTFTKGEFNYLNFQGDFEVNGIAHEDMSVEFGTKTGTLLTKDYEFKALGEVYLIVVSPAVIDCAKFKTAVANAPIQIKFKNASYVPDEATLSAKLGVPIKDYKADGVNLHFSNTDYDAYNILELKADDVSSYTNITYINSLSVLDDGLDSGLTDIGYYLLFIETLKFNHITSTITMGYNGMDPAIDLPLTTLELKKVTTIKVDDETQPDTLFWNLPHLTTLRLDSLTTLITGTEENDSFTEINEPNLTVYLNSVFRGADDLHSNNEKIQGLIDRGATIVWV